MDPLTRIVPHPAVDHNGRDLTLTNTAFLNRRLHTTQSTKATPALVNGAIIANNPLTWDRVREWKPNNSHRVHRLLRSLRAYYNCEFNDESDEDIWETGWRWCFSDEDAEDIKDNKHAFYPPHDWFSGIENVPWSEMRLTSTTALDALIAMDKPKNRAKWDAHIDKENDRTDELKEGKRLKKEEKKRKATEP